MKKISFLTGMLIICCLLGQSVIAQAKSFEKFIYISPKPGSKFINPENTIVFRHGDVLDFSTVKSDGISVSGSLRGKISGSLKLSKDQRTLIFTPDQLFSFKEKINVVLQEGIRTISGLELEGVEFSFYVKEQDNIQMLEDFYQEDFERNLSMMDKSQVKSQNKILKKKFVDSYPEDFPSPYVTELDNPSEGYVLATLRQAGSPIYNNYLAIIDKYGTPVYYRKATNVPNDFKVVPDNKLAFCNFNNTDVPNNAYYLMDQRFNVIDTLKMGNGYYVDQHDLLMLENGDRFMMAYDPQLIDMSQIVPDGDTNATVIGLIIQKLDFENNVIFQWSSWDHFEITDGVGVDLTSNIVDYSHGNAFELDNDQNSLLISSRNMHEITKVDLETGDIIWRFGLHSLNNEFTFIDDTIGFCFQHDIRVLPNGNITIYDNGNCHNPPFSQSLEYTLDTANMTATQVWNYINDPVVYGRATGSSRRLNDGNTFICWGFTEPVGMTEVKPDGSKTWELNVAEKGVNYRGIKSTWVTDYFETSIDTIDFGIYDDNIPWPYIVVLTNNNDEDIEITSTLNNTTSYSVVTPIPLTIPANGTANLIISFLPTQQGQIDDVLTLRSESMLADTLPQMIARQVFLTGFVEDNLAPEVLIIPFDSAINVSQMQVLTINFNESIVKADGSNLKTSEISEIIEFKETDVSGEDVGYSAFIDAWKKVITITPDTLKPLQTYYLELKSNTVSDNSGNVLTAAITSTFTTEEEQGIIELSEQNFAKVYPNPNKGLVTIEFENMDSKDIQVYDLKGNVVHSIKQVQQSIIELDLQNLPKGVYIIKVQNQVNNKSIELKTLKN